MDQQQLRGDEVKRLENIGDVVIPTAKPKKRILHEQAGIFLNYRHDAECEKTKKINHALQVTRKYKTAPPTVGLDARLREAGIDPSSLESLEVLKAVADNGVEKEGPKTAEEIQAAMADLQAQMDALAPEPTHVAQATAALDEEVVEEEPVVVAVAAPVKKKVAKKKAKKKVAAKTTEPEL